MAWRVAKSLEVLLAQFNAKYPNRSKASDGSIGDASHASRDSDHNPWFGPGIVTARDFTHDPAHGMDIARLALEVAATRDRRIKYIICNRRILDSRAGSHPWVWMPYSGTNPHDHHFHLSVMDNASCDDTSPWKLASFGDVPGPAPVPAPSGGNVSPDIDTLIRNLDRDLRADLHVKQLQLDELVKDVTDLRAAVASLSVQKQL
jgi:hypothetical protein